MPVRSAAVVVSAAVEGRAPGLLALLQKRLGDRLIVVPGDVPCAARRWPVVGPTGLTLGEPLAESGVQLVAVPSPTVPLPGQVVSVRDRVLVSDAVPSSGTRALLARVLAVEERAIDFLPPAPADEERALDATVVALPDGAVIVPEILEAAFADVRLAHEVGVARLLQTFLDQRALDLGQMFRKVERLPVLPPVYLVKAPDHAAAWTGVLVTPTQALVVDGPAPFAILPRHQTDAFSLQYRALAGEVLAAWTDRFTRAGLDAVSFDVELCVRARTPLSRLAVMIPRGALS